MTFWKLLETEMGNLSSSGPNTVGQEGHRKHQGQRGEESGRVIVVGAEWGSFELDQRKVLCVCIYVFFKGGTICIQIHT